MAVSRGGIAFWVGCVHNNSRGQPIRKQFWTIGQAVDLLCIRQTRPLRSASWGLSPPNSLRYQEPAKRSVLAHPFHNASQPQRCSSYDDDWDEPPSECVPAQQREPDVFHTQQDIALLTYSRMKELLAADPPEFLQFFLPVTTVDGRREDDISMGTLKKNNVDAVNREHGCFRSLFQMERCPAPFLYGSQFYCFHCPDKEPAFHSAIQSKDKNIERVEGPAVHPTYLCLHAESRAPEGDKDAEEKMAVMYERLRSELPVFFLKPHDYSMYSPDVEFVNGILNTKMRGRTLYQLTLSLWRFLCLCYYAEARLEVLKLTKHMEDGTIKARWRIRGLPFHSIWIRFYRKDKTQLYRLYDAFSTFYIGKDGLIQCHKVEKVMPAQPPALPRVTTLLAGVLVAMGVQENRPALNLFPLLMSSLRPGRN